MVCMGAVDCELLPPARHSPWFFYWTFHSLHILLSSQLQCSVECTSLSLKVTNDSPYNQYRDNRVVCFGALPIRTLVPRQHFTTAVASSFDYHISVFFVHAYGGTSLHTTTFPPQFINLLATLYELLIIRSYILEKKIRNILVRLLSWSIKCIYIRNPRGYTFWRAGF